MPFLIYHASAFEMLKTSGTMRLIKDKAMVQSIWKCYAELEILRDFSDYYIQRKTAELDKFGGFNERTISKPELMFGFFTSLFSENMAKAFNDCSKRIDETLLMF